MRRTLVTGLVGLAGLVMAVGAVAGSAAGSAAAGSGDGERHRDSELAKAFLETTRTTEWRELDRIPLRFDTHHPQGFALVGDKIFLSTVEIIEPPERYPEPVHGYDRSPGRGVGHVLVLDRSGELLEDITIGEGTVYHPGGIDFDGTSVWVPVAEYRPDSKAIVYRLDPDTYQVTEEFRVDDHVGGVVRDQVTGEVHGVSWGSRTMYTWTPNGRQLAEQPNNDHFLDYQDCAYVGWRKQLCSGVTGLPTSDGGSYELGGLVLRELRDGRIVHQLPIPLFSSAGHVLTRNPVALEVVDGRLRMLAAPDDGEEPAGTELYILEASD